MLNTRPNRRDAIFNRVPGRADLDAGQLAVNTADGIVYTKLGTGEVVPIAGRSINGGGGTSFELPIATDAILGGIRVGANLSITADGVLSAQQGQDGFVLQPATRSTLGGVIVGSRLSIGPDGTLSADAATLPIASPSVLGGVRVGSGLRVDAGGLLETTTSAFVLPVATNTVLGGVRVGSGLGVTADGTLSVPDDRVLRAGDTMTGMLRVRASSTTTDGIQIGANTEANARPRLALTSRDFSTWWGVLDAGGNGSVTTLAGRQQLVLSAVGSFDDNNGRIRIESSPNSWAVCTFARAAQTVSWIDSNGNLIRGTRDVTALPSMVSADAGLAEVLALTVVGPAITTPSIEAALPAAMERHILPATEGRAETEELVGVSDTVIVSALVKAIQELTARVEALEHP